MVRSAIFPLVDKSTLVLADGHEVVRQGLAAFFATEPEIVVVGQCSDGLAALKMIQSLAPDFAVLDLHLPKMTAAQVIYELARLRHKPTELRTRTIILSASRDGTGFNEALRAGADALLLKECPGLEVLAAIKYVREGGIYITSLLRDVFFTKSRRTQQEAPLFSGRDPEPGIPPPGGHNGTPAVPALDPGPFRGRNRESPLSRREYEIVSMMAIGMTRQQISSRLCISEKDLDARLQRLKEKLLFMPGDMTPPAGSPAGTPAAPGRDPGPFRRRRDN